MVRLERIQIDMRACLEAAFAAAKATQFRRAASKPVNLNPREPKILPHITSTNQLLNPKDTVIASGEGTATTAKPLRQDPRFDEVPVRSEVDRGHRTKLEDNKSRTDSGSLLKITPAQLLNLAPKLRTYLGNQNPRWPEVVDAADWLREELGISKFIWGDVCTVMGREQAAIAVAIVSTKPPGYFRGSAGAYFHGMVSRAKSGELHLTRTLWGMRSQEGRPGSPQ